MGGLLTGEDRIQDQDSGFDPVTNADNVKSIKAEEQEGLQECQDPSHSGIAAGCPIVVQHAVQLGRSCWVLIAISHQGSKDNQREEL